MYSLNVVLLMYIPELTPLTLTTIFHALRDGNPQIPARKYHPGAHSSSSSSSSGSGSGSGSSSSSSNDNDNSHGRGGGVVVVVVAVVIVMVVVMVFYCVVCMPLEIKVHS